MCHPVRCRSCGLLTWRGCGLHVAPLTASVPAAQWCPGPDGRRGIGLLRRLLGR